MKTLVVLSLDLPEPEDVVATVKALNLKAAPHYTGEFRVVFEPYASALEEYLDQSL